MHASHTGWADGRALRTRQTHACVHGSMHATTRQERLHTSRHATPHAHQLLLAVHLAASSCRRAGCCQMGFAPDAWLLQPRLVVYLGDCRRHLPAACMRCACGVRVLAAAPARRRTALTGNCMQVRAPGAPGRWRRLCVLRSQHPPVHPPCLPRALAAIAMGGSSHAISWMGDAHC